MQTAEDIQSIIQPFRDSAKSSTEMMLATFAHVPDDKAEWAPSPTAKSALAIIAHCAEANYAFAKVIRGEDLGPTESKEEALQNIRESGRDAVSRQEAIRQLEDSTAQVLEAMDHVQPEQLDTMPDSPFGPMPFRFWLSLPGRHTLGHKYQIDYLQTIWGDLEFH